MSPSTQPYRAARFAALAVPVLMLTACGSVAESTRTEGVADSDVVSAEPADEAGEPEAKDEAKLSVAEYGFSQMPAGQYGTPPSVTYGVVFENTGAAIAINAKVQIAFSDKSGAVVDSEET